MTLLEANTTLHDIAAKDAGTTNYSYAPASGMTPEGTVKGSVSAAGGNVTYSVASNTATNLTFGSVAWDENNPLYTRQANDIAYTSATVDTSNIGFTGTTSLAKDDTMTLVSNFGDSVGKLRGSVFTLGGATYKGHAYWDSATQNLMYMVDRGIGETVAAKDAIDESASETGTKQGDVIGGEAEGDGTARGNEAAVTGGTVRGSVVGGYGNANGNTVLLGGGTVNGNPSGGITPGGVYGGYSTGGSTENNTICLFGDADISGTDIYGGNQGASGNTLNVGYTPGGTPTAWSGGGQTVRNLKNFQAINFSVVPWNETTAALTITDGANTDLSAATVKAENVTFTGGQAMAKGRAMTFLNQSNVAAANRASAAAGSSAFTAGVALEGMGSLSLDADGNVIYNVESVKASGQTHNTVMAAEASMAALSMGNDFIGEATDGLKLQANIGEDGIADVRENRGREAQAGNGEPRRPPHLQRDPRPRAHEQERKNHFRVRRVLRVRQRQLHHA